MKHKQVKQIICSVDLNSELEVAGRGMQTRKIVIGKLLKVMNVVQKPNTSDEINNYTHISPRLSLIQQLPLPKENQQNYLTTKA